MRHRVFVNMPQSGNVRIVASRYLGRMANRKILDLAFAFQIPERFLRFSKSGEQQIERGSAVFDDCVVSAPKHQGLLWDV